MDEELKDPVKMREWLMRNYHLQQEMQAFNTLNGEYSDDLPYAYKRSLFVEAAKCRVEIYEFLKGCTLRPREMEVIRLHCLLCKSWSEIARQMKKDRRNLIRTFDTAVRHLTQQI